MSKKKPASKTAAKQAAKGTRVPQKRRTPAATPPVPGMEQVRYSDLDARCVSIAEIRAELNAKEKEDAEECRQALDEMRAHGLQTYRHAGVELSRVPGEEKLRVRTSKEKATAETEDDGDE